MPRQLFRRAACVVCGTVTDAFGTEPWTAPLCESCQSRLADWFLQVSSDVRRKMWRIEEASAHDAPTPAEELVPRWREVNLLAASSGKPVTEYQMRMDLALAFEATGKTQSALLEYAAALKAASNAVERSKAAGMLLSDVHFDRSSMERLRTVLDAIVR